MDRRLFSKELDKRLLDLRSEHPDIMKVGTIGKTIRGKDIQMVTITDPSEPSQDKERILVVAGHHGDEEGGRWAAMAMVEWLVTQQAVEVIKKQEVFVIPCVNVDGCDSEEPLNANGVNLNTDYNRGTGLTQPESKAVWGMVEKYHPEVVVDVHGLGAGSTGEYTVTHPHGETPWDSYAHRKIVEVMDEEATRRGHPQDRDDHGAWPSGEPVSLSDNSYIGFHSLDFTLEVNETTSTIEQMKESGLIRLRTLLQQGLLTWPGERYSGYPNRVVAKHGHVWLCSYGATAEERRKSRVELWQGRDKLKVVQIGPMRSDRVIAAAYKTDLYWFIRHGISLRLRMPKEALIEEVVLSGGRLKDDEYTTWKDDRWSYVEMGIYRDWPRPDRFTYCTAHAIYSL